MKHYATMILLILVLVLSIAALPSLFSYGRPSNIQYYFCSFQRTFSTVNTFFHIGPAVIHYIKGDLHKILAILFSNLFITELMFNNKRITSFLFNNISQYSCAVNTILVLLLLYMSVYICLFAVLQLIGIIFRWGLP